MFDVACRLGQLSTPTPFWNPHFDIRQAVRWKMLAEDPCVGVDLSRVKRKEMEAPSVEECRRFLDVAERSEWFPILALALTTGMRPSEYLALKWTDVN
jgi:integrase